MLVVLTEHIGSSNRGTMARDLSRLWSRAMDDLHCSRYGERERARASDWYFDRVLEYSVHGERFDAATL